MSASNSSQPFTNKTAPSIGQAFRRGMRDGLPIGLGYFAVSFSMGIVARNAGFSIVQGFMASLLNNSSSGQYALFTLVAAGASLWQLAVVTFIANARYLLMSCALSQRLAPDMPMIHRFILGFDVTDELFAITIAQPGAIRPWYTYGAIITSAPFWASGLALGIIMGNILPLRITSALSVALYGMFLAVIIPPARKNPVVAAAVSVSFAASCLINHLPLLADLSSGNKTIILTVGISAIAAILRPVKQEESSHEQ